MIIILTVDKLNRAQQICESYGHKLVYSKLMINNQVYYAISEGPVGALLTIRAELGDKYLQNIFGLE